MNVNVEHVAALKHNVRQARPNISNVLASDWAAERYVSTFERPAHNGHGSLDAAYDMVYTVAVDLD